MFNKKILIIYLFIINMIISLTIMIAWATTNGIYNTPELAFDSYRTVWVFVGTGDKTNPEGTTGGDMLLGVRDATPASNTTYALGALSTVTSSTSCANDPTAKGWVYYLRAYEKCLADALVSNTNVYFTTYIPPASTVGCGISGTPYLYVMDYQSGCGANAISLTNDGASGSGSSGSSGGTGIASAPVASVNPITGATDIFISTSSAGTGSDSHTFKITDPNQGNSVTAHPIYWRDLRLQ